MAENKMEKTLWFQMGRVNATEQDQIAGRMDLAHFNTKQTGLIKSMRVRFGRKIGNKMSPVNAYMLVEVESEKSIAKVISMLAKGKFMKHRKLTYRCYKAGTNTYVQIRRSKMK